MKKLFFLTSIIALTSCITRKEKPAVTISWKTKNRLEIIIDSTQKDVYTPTYIKVILKKEKRTKIKNKNHK